MELTRIVLAALLAAAPLAARADAFVELSGGALRIEVHGHESANLIYHLDCLAELIGCSDAFGTMWRAELGYDDGDRRHIGEWIALRKAVQMRESTPPEPSPRAKASLPLPPANRDGPWNQMRWAGFVSSDAGIEEAWAPHASAHQIAGMRGVMKHFEPRFHRWWAANEAAAAAFVPALDAAMHKARAFELLAAASRFYGADLGDGRVFLHLFVVPKVKHRGTNGEQIGAHAIVEIVPGENPEKRVPVIVHEMMHYVFGAMPKERQAALIDQLVASGADGVPAWNLFDEIQATAIGSIIAARNVWSAERFQKRSAMPRGFYADDAIDLGARATYQLFEEAFAAGGPMRPSFTASYVEALRKALGARLQTPSLTLKRMALNVDPEDLDRLKDLRRAVRASSISTNDELGGEKFATQLDTYSALSAVVLVRADRVSKLAGAARSIGVTPDELTKALAFSGGVIFIARRTAQAYAFVLVAREAATFGPLIAAVPSCKLKPGVCHRVP